VPFEVILSRYWQEAAGVRVLELVAPDGGDLPAWEPGAHLEIQLRSGFVRHYSLCGDPADRTVYRIAVLLEPQGRGGSWEIHELDDDARLTVTSVINRFALVDSPRYVFLAGGVGITPILPMIRAARAAGAETTVVYLGRSRDSMAFTDEVAAVPGAVVHPSGTLGRWDLEALYPAAKGAAVYVCGPAALIEGIQAVHTRMGGKPQDLHLERFHATVPQPGGAGDTAFEVQLGEGGPIVEVDADQTITGALVANGYPVPFSCEEGVCGTCQTTVLAGEPDHRDDTLDEDEHADGEMLICVSRSKSPRLVLDIQL
jgi:ferredoxin-NADP reductase